MSAKREAERRKAAKDFVSRWLGRGDEKSEAQVFWIELLNKVFGVENYSDFIRFEKRTKNLVDQTNFIDGYIASTKILIEQKSKTVNLRRGVRGKDGEALTPFKQAQKYIVTLPVDEHPRYVITCNFKEFLIYDMNQPNSEPESILLENLAEELYRLEFIVNNKSEHLRKEEEVSFEAGERVGMLYDALYKQYKNPEDPNSLHSLNILCVRLVFCLYAEDADLFDGKSAFYDYFAPIPPEKMRTELIELFKVLNTPENERDPYLEDTLASFPYVNGGLFNDFGDIEIPQFTEEIKQTLLIHCSLEFDWSQISPTIFGAIFESTLNPETRRKGGMHYTSIENINKLIDPLFMDDINTEFEEICELKQKKSRDEKLRVFQDKLAQLKFFDPACGSGNFLTQTFLRLRNIENDIIRLLEEDNTSILMGGIINPIKVSISQFYGIEINDFAVTVAKTALWIAEHQMYRKTREIIYFADDFLPLKTNANIVEGNALRIDWETVVPKNELNYIMGNPPFIGAMMMSRGQHDDLENVFPECKKVGEADYVSGWFAMATKLMINTEAKCALVSTNSICQGQSVANIWKPLFEMGVDIDFAYKTFCWDNESTEKAHVHCVIVGFSSKDSIKKTRYLFESERKNIANNINPYLIDAPNIFIENRSKPLCDVPSMNFGNMPRDGGNLILTEDEKEKLIQEEPCAKKFIHLLLGAEEYINNKKRYCLWLTSITPTELRAMPKIYERVLACKKMRESSKAEGTRKMAAIPHLFAQRTQPEGIPFMVVPRVSSERRKYIPLGFLSSDIKATDSVQIIPNATLYHFGILTSNVHMSWMRTVCGRLKSDYRYSKDIVYNNFPWPTPTEKQKAKIEQTAQGILDARAKYPDSSLADLYDELTMQPELRTAHQKNDKTVMEAYGFWGKFNTESECVAELMKMYQKLVEKEQRGCQRKSKHS